MKKLLALEGIRGVAAVMVVIYHILLTFYPVMFSGSDTGHKLENMLYANPLGSIVNGVFAVSVFFVLSGFVLSISFFQTGEDNVVKRLAAKRYLRLMIPALASVMVTWIILAFGINKNLDISAITPSWAPSIWTTAPDFFAALYQGTVGTFIHADTSFNPVLWTMFFEFTGSLFVFLFLLIFGKSKYRWVFYILLAAFTYRTWYLGFTIGIALADAYAHRQSLFKMSIGVSVLMVLAGLFFGGYPKDGGHLAGSIYQYLNVGWYPQPLSLFSIGIYELYNTIGAALIIVAVLSTPLLTKLFDKLSWLGKYTFSMYLIHVAVLFTVIAGSFIFLYKSLHLGYSLAVLISSTVGLIVIAGITYAFERYIDSPAIRFSGRVADLLFRKDLTEDSKPRSSEAIAETAL